MDQAQPKNAGRKLRPRAYSTWTGVHTRCRNEGNPDYPRWGGRGIRVCARWESFENFLADMGERPPGMSIDRIDNDGNYEPSNCRWATFAEQQRNKRGLTRIAAFGEVRTVKDWARDPRCSIDRTQLARRIKKGMPPELAIAMPSRRAA